jgi:hypothetical protein
MFVPSLRTIVVNEPIFRFADVDDQAFNALL